METYPSLDAYNEDVIAAREAYAADMEVEAGRCESGDGHARASKYDRRCRACRHGAA